ncbi:MAG: septum formation family protein [Acidimicrobiales bacterium]
MSFGVRPLVMRRLVLVLASVALIAVSCTAATTNDAEAPVEPAIVQITPQPTGEDQPTPAPEGRIENKYDLEVSWCFNRYEIYSEQFDESTEVTTVVDCRRPHDGEVYATYFNPAGADAPYPGNAETERWAKLSCYSGFASFMGVDYELSALEIGVIRPTEETWTGEGVHREATCYVYAPDAQLTGAMESSEI